MIKLTDIKNHLRANKIYYFAALGLVAVSAYVVLSSGDFSKLFQGNIGNDGGDYSPKNLELNNIILEGKNGGECLANDPDGCTLSYTLKLINGSADNYRSFHGVLNSPSDSDFYSLLSFSLDFLPYDDVLIQDSDRWVSLSDSDLSNRHLIYYAEYNSAGDLIIPDDYTYRFTLSKKLRFAEGGAYNVSVRLGNLAALDPWQVSFANDMSGFVFKTKIFTLEEKTPTETPPPAGQTPVTETPVVETPAVTVTSATTSFKPALVENFVLMFTGNQEGVPVIVSVYKGGTFVKFLSNIFSIHPGYNYTFTWDGKDSTGNIMPDGQYSYRINKSRYLPMEASGTPRPGQVEGDLLQQGTFSIGSPNPVVTLQPLTRGFDPEQGETFNIAFTSNQDAYLGVEIYRDLSPSAPQFKKEIRLNAEKNEITSLIWDGKDSTGQTVPVGQYYFEIRKLHLLMTASTGEPIYSVLDPANPNEPYLAKGTFLIMDRQYKPDLTVNDIWFNQSTTLSEEVATLEMGATYKLLAVTDNLDTNTSLTDGEKLLTEFGLKINGTDVTNLYMRNLQPGVEATHTLMNTLKVSTPLFKLGENIIEVTVDQTGKIPETNETNNTKTIRINVVDNDTDITPPNIGTLPDFDVTPPNLGTLPDLDTDVTPPTLGTMPDLDTTPPSLTLPTSNIIVNSRAFPDSFNPQILETEIQYELSEKVKIEIKIQNSSGEKIVTLVDDVILEAGEHSVFWNGTDTTENTGTIVDPGEYKYVIIAKDQFNSGVKDTDEDTIDVVYAVNDFEDIETPPPSLAFNFSSDPEPTPIPQEIVIMQNQNTGRTSETGPEILIYGFFPAGYYLMRKFRKLIKK